MHTKLLPTLVLGFVIGIVGFVGCGGSSGGTSSSGGSTSATGGKASGGSTGGAATGGAATGGAATGGAATGGAATGGAATGGKATGGSANGGTASGGTASGGTASGGTASGGKATGGTGMGGTSGSAGNGGTAAGGSAGNGGTAAGGGGSAGNGGTGIDGGAGNGGAAVPSAGCGKADGLKTLTTGGSSITNGLSTSTRLKITSGGSSREYIIDVPADYDPSHPYRLIFSWHQAYGSANGNAIGQYPAGNGPNFDAKNYAYFGLRREATNANQPAIFVAPQGIGDYPWEFTRDSALFDSLLALVGSNLCTDESRVFTTGFSYGAMMSYSLSITRQTKLRAAVTMAAANYNLPGQPTDSNAAPIAYLGFTGMSDGMCPWIRNGNSTTEGGKYCVLTHAKDNGCTTSATITTATVGGKTYLCYDFEGCKAGYPVKVCTFDGGHTPSSVNDGTSTGDDGLKAFIPPLAWKFIAQF